MSIDPLKRRRLNWAAGLLLVAAIAGCGEDDAIKTTDTPREGPPRTPVTVEQVRESLDHMLVAIVPQGEQAWFFKLVAPTAAVEELRQPFADFMASLTPASDKAADPAMKPPTWKLPEGWVERPGNAMRAATIEIPYGGGNLELTVSSLPLSGEWGSYVTVNVNRWLRQLQQPPAAAETIAEWVKTTPIQNGKATVVELNGWMDRQAMGMPAGHPPMASTNPSSTADAPEGPAVPPVTAAAAPAPPTAKTPAEFDYQMPAGWQPGTLNSMRKAAFNVADGDRKAEMTVTVFSASGAMADPAAQLQRWAGEVGLAGLPAEEMAKLQTEVTIDGQPGQQFELLGPADAPGALGTRAAMLRRGDQMWFFKLKGDRTLVEGQKAAFDEFLGSVRFAGEN